MNFTADQMLALENGEPVPCVLNHTECVLVRKDVFERINPLLHDDGEIMSDEILAQAEANFAEADCAEAIQAIREGLEDIRHGRYEPANIVISEIRSRLESRRTVG